MHSQDSADKIDATQKKYQQSEKGKASLSRFEKTEKFRASLRTYNKSELGQQAHLRYILSEKGKKSLKKNRDLRKLMTQAASWLEQNPSKTINDFLETKKK